VPEEQRAELDGITLEVIHHGFLSVAEQMRRTLVRTAFNPGIYEVLDFGISIYTPELKLIAEATGIAVFLGANDMALEHALRHVGPENLRPGDVILLNYPYWSSAHTYDAVLVAPVFMPEPDQHRLISYLAIRAHWRDLGAKDPGYVLDSTSLHQEGCVFPATRVMKAYEFDSEWIDFIRFNSRMPEIVLGDLNAQVSSIRVGEKGVQEIYARYGSEQVEATIEAVIAHGRRLVQRRLAELPRGSWTASDYMDDDGVSEDPVRVAVTITITADEFVVGFQGSQDQVPGPINMPFGATVAMVKNIFKSLTSPDAPANAGHFEQLKVIAPEGNLFHAVYPAPTFTLWTHMVATEVIRNALAQALPEVGASSAGDEPGFMAVVQEPLTGESFVISNLEGIGWGGTPSHDGASAQQNPCETVGRNTPVEVLEQKAGLFHESLQLRGDSGGPGQYRGGLGIRRVVQASRPGEILSMKKKTLTATRGLAGGHSGANNGFVIYPGTARERRLRMQRAPLSIGDRFVNLSGGGAGYGDPLDRAPQDVLDDVIDGYVSEQNAWDIYGVRIRAGNILELSPERAAHSGQSGAKTARPHGNGLTPPTHGRARELGEHK
jgi:N-methylhydantoinase B